MVAVHSIVLLLAVFAALVNNVDSFGFQRGASRNTLTTTSNRLSRLGKVYTPISGAFCKTECAPLSMHSGGAKDNSCKCDDVIAVRDLNFQVREYGLCCYLGGYGYSSVMFLSYSTFTSALGRSSSIMFYNNK